MITASIHDLHKQYNMTKVLKGIHLDVYHGELLSLVGSSGCGKSTLLYTIAGLEKPEAGTIMLNNKIVFSAKKKINVKTEQRHVGLVFQSYALWPHMTVYNNIAYPLSIKKVCKHVIKKEVLYMVALVGLEGKENKYPHELSGGEQQRVAVARSIIMQPDILLLDEPFSNLDAKLREKMQDELKKIQQVVKLTMIHVTHDQEEAMGISDRIGVMDDGKLLQVDTPSHIYHHPQNQFVASFIGKSNLLSYDQIKPYLEEGIKIKGRKAEKVLVRPEDITIETSDTVDKNGQISKMMNKGSVLLYLVKTDMGNIMVQTHHTCLYPKKMPVQIKVNKACFVE